MRRENFNNENRLPEKGKWKAASVGVILLAAFVSAIVVSYAMSDHISRDSKKLMSAAVRTVEDSTDIDVKEIFPISKDTEKLISAGTVVLQNPDFMLNGDTVIHTISIGSSEQSMILDAIEEQWPESRSPWVTGYAGLCEKWVCDVYREADIPVKDACCAARSREELAIDTGRIPAGAMIYSDDGYTSGTICEICGNDPGHVAIYLGNGMVAGSQAQYIMTFAEFRRTFGYGGWSLGGNSPGQDI